MRSGCPACSAGAAQVPPGTNRTGLAPVGSRRVEVAPATGKAEFQTVSFVSGSGTQTHTYTGAKLVDLITAAVPKFRTEVKNDLLRYAVLVKASDGYESVLSWPEITSGFGGVQALVASTEDGVSLADVGPRLTVPSDTKGGRYVSWITSITLVRVGS
ncbi:hypothetical protein [Parafrankia sp. EUN1f]|uniref:hypothetical protein n=1 Tax=Parafrankia sp. EUN1f TaxID=102897 RepID=UPI0001C45124|nr:hypothetical protein [Parafrankia sp. EUN1f]EFC84994.1 hypothetical protein FrEUN1fDRAFT_1906 [Parafrankia sp. EUN1f]